MTAKTFIIIIKIDHGMDGEDTLVHASEIEGREGVMLEAISLLFKEENAYKAIIRDYEGMNIIGEITV